MADPGPGNLPDVNDKITINKFDGDEKNYFIPRRRVKAAFAAKGLSGILSIRVRRSLLSSFPNLGPTSIAQVLMGEVVGDLTEGDIEKLCES